MWARLWRGAVRLAGAESAMFENAAGVRDALDRYLSRQSHSPSPHTLMLRHLQIPEGPDVHIGVADEGDVSAKQRCESIRNAEASTEVHAEAPAEMPARRAES